MTADFSKLLKHLSDNLEAHADRDQLSPVRRALFLSRGGHAPGEVCPTEEPSERGERAWCLTCERYHEPMEWGEGCTDKVADVAGQGHHSVKREVVPGVWEVARPLRDTSRWHRWRQERACRKTTGHCWHPDGFVDWFCCMCSANTDGMPPQRCVHCAEPEDVTHGR